VGPKTGFSEGCSTRVGGLALAEGDDHLEGDDEGTESEYDDDYEDDEEDIRHQINWDNLEHQAVDLRTVAIGSSLQKIRRRGGTDPQRNLSSVPPRRRIFWRLEPMATVRRSTAWCSKWPRPCLHRG
jgi:hypothetical protein